MTKLSPSSAARRVACPGSRALEARVVDDGDGDARKEGQAAHWLAQEMLYNYENPTWTIPTEAYNGVAVTEEMTEGAEEYLATVESMIKQHVSPVTFRDLHVEEYLDIPSFHPNCGGVPDCWFYADNRLYIWDYKYGHAPVEAFENWQLLEYAAGLIYDVLKLDDQKTHVYMTIVQPRGFHSDGITRTWSERACNLRAHFNILRGAEEEASKEVADCKVSKECRYCSARHLCGALRTAAASASDIAEQNTPWDLKSDELGVELRFLRHAKAMLDARVDAMEEQALAMLKRGDAVPFYGLANKVGRLRWNKPDAEIFALGDLTKKDLKKTPVPITPTQAIQLGIEKSLIALYSEKPISGQKLVEQTTQQARKIFGGRK